MTRATCLPLLLLIAARAVAADEGTLCTWPLADTAAVTCSSAPRDVVALGEGGIRFVVTIADTDGRSIEDATLTIRGKSRAWRMAIPKPFATRRLTFVAEAGMYEMTAAAPHYRPASRTTSAEAVTLFLRRYPVVSGVVRTGAGSPLANASVRGTDGHYATKSDATGSFSVEIDDLWPGRFEISYPGLTTKIVAVPLSERDATLAAVTLRDGAAVAFDVHADGRTRGAISAELLREDGLSHLLLQKKTVDSLPARTSFEDLDGGQYQLLLRGPEPLQRLIVPVRVKAGESVLQEAQITPLALTVRVTQGGNPVPYASVEIQPLATGGWQSTVTADGQGEIAAELWQRGELLFAVNAPEQAVPAAFVKTPEGLETALIEIALPDRQIGGRVIDASNGAPVAGADVSIETESDDGMEGSFGVKTDADGRFTFRAVPAGAHAIGATSPDHLRSSPVRFHLGENDRSRELEIRLRRATQVPVQIVSASGVPLGGAAILVRSGGAVQTALWSDDAGRANVPLAASAPTMLYVFPKQGSFAITRILSESKEERRVVVPEGTASLQLRTTDTQGRPVGDVRFLLRFNGELIPPEVASWAERRTGLPTRTNAGGEASFARMPPGIAELWPMRADSEMGDMPPAAGPAAPAQIALEPGENLATMILRRKQ